jgi:hypothetical protein
VPGNSWLRSPIKSTWIPLGSCSAIFSLRPLTAAGHHEHGQIVEIELTSIRKLVRAHFRLTRHTVPLTRSLRPTSQSKVSPLYDQVASFQCLGENRIEPRRFVGMQ